MNNSRYELDMTQGPMLKNILRFAIPYMLTSLLQIFYNAADLVVVSRWSGSEAMASVGATSSLVNLLVNLFLGMSVGASVTISRSFGANDDERIHRAVHTSVLFSIVLGVGALIVGQIFCRPLLIAMDTPAGNVLNGAVLYMRIIFVGTPATIIYNFGAAVLRSVGDTKRPLYILSASGIVNVALNLVFVINFKMGVAGVALATIISKYLSVVCVVVTLARAEGSYRLSFRSLRFFKNELRDIVKTGLPAGIQNTVMGLSNTIIQASVNSFGAAAMSGSAAASNIESFAFSVKDAFRQATVTAISQNYGARNKKRMDRSFVCCLMSMLVTGVLFSVIMTAFAKPLLSLSTRELNTIWF